MPFDRRQPAAVLRAPDERPGIAGTAYDTAWIASVAAPDDRRSSRFPTSLQWLVEHQQSDGSWGGDVRYEHDRVLCTLAALTPLALFGRRAIDHACVEAGTRYLWQRGHLLHAEPQELVGFELLLPTLIRRAKAAGVAVPPHLDIYARQRDEKLKLLPREALYSPRATVVHSLEFLGDEVELDRLRAVQGGNGAIGNSPAATAFFLDRTDDRRALGYLRASLAHSGGATAPVLHPCETFELLWAAYHLYLAGVPASALLSPAECTSLVAALSDGGVSLSPTFPIPDADDTAVALLLLADLGYPVHAGVLAPFCTPAGHFASFPYERHSSVGVNLHVLHALLRVPGFADAPAAISRVLDYLAEQHSGLFWTDKWHISPYYATSHALCVLRELPSAGRARVATAVERSRAWLRESQNADGSWGFYGQPTAEETAYAMLGLALGSVGELPQRDRWRIARGERFLARTLDGAETCPQAPLPPLWIDKCLYTPTLVVQAVIAAARAAADRVAGQPEQKAGPRTTLRIPSTPAAPLARAS